MSMKSPIARKARAKSAAASMMSAAPMVHTHKVCRSCSSLPAGSVELVSLLLVLVFSLTAVLVTSGYALQKQSVEIERLSASL
jgi:hypothetical protein